VLGVEQEVSRVIVRCKPDQPLDTDHPARPFRLLLCWLGTVIGCAGLSAAFLHGLSTVSVAFNNQGWLLYSLPLLGLASVWIYRHWAAAADGGMRRVQDAVEGGQTLAPSTAPAIVATTLLSHLGGASVGREGTAVQMGAGIADLCVDWAKPGPGARRMLLLCGIAAGFSAVFGTPLAAAIFALEFVRQRSWGVVPCLAAAFLADLVGRKIFFATHADYRLPVPATYDLEGLGSAAVLGLACGLIARLYLWLSQHEAARKNDQPYARIFFAGVTFSLMVYFYQLQDFTGLGLHVIDSALVEPSAPKIFLIKLLLTGLCVCAGYRGGEVTPLFFVGATLGSAAAAYLSLPLGVCAALGFVAVFAGAGAMPLAGAVMAGELFGWSIGGYALLACAVSWLVAGRKGLYSEA